MSRAAAWSAVAALILLPLLAGLMTGQVRWDPQDFPFAFVAILLAVAGATVETAARVPPRYAYRAGFAFSLVAASILVWMNGAVGIIGNEENPLNWMYGGVLATGIAGAVVARFQPGGMAVAMAATALAQVMVALLAQFAGHFIWVLTGFFVALWLISAYLFWKAAQERTASG